VAILAALEETEDRKEAKEEPAVLMEVVEVDEVSVAEEVSVAVAVEVSVDVSVEVSVVV
jgi:hypothetical protein